MEFLKDQNVLYLEKLGIQKHFSNVHEMIRPTEKVEKAVDNNLFVG